ncbi:MAG: NUDIX hydrolase [Patescibacteria group bacterium]
MENETKKVGVSQKAIIFNSDNEILALRRSSTHQFKPFTWDLPGGDLDFGEEPLVGISREIKEETGLEIIDLTPFDVDSRINGNNEFWVTIAYIAFSESVNVHLSYEHDEFKWVTLKQFLKLESSEKLHNFVKKLEK